jgi:hypothetical protein
VTDQGDVVRPGDREPQTAPAAEARVDELRPLHFAQRRASEICAPPAGRSLNWSAAKRARSSTLDTTLPAAARPFMS